MISSMHFLDETLSEDQVKTINDGISKNDIKTLSIRDCKVSIVQLKTVLKAAETCKSLLQLSLCVGVLASQKHLDLLCRCIKSNRSLQALFIHGNDIGDAGMKKLAKVLLYHPFITSLDVGDCNLSDDSIESICNLLPPHGKKTGLIDLTLSSNPRISEQGWIKLSVSMAASSCLQELYMDYNNLGDLAASSILVGLASHRHLQVLDMERTSVTDKFAKLLLYLIENFPTKLQKVALEDNSIDRKLLKSIKSCLLDTETESEMSERTQDDLNLTSKEASEVEDEEVEYEDLINTDDKVIEREIKTLETTLNSNSPLKKTKSPKKKTKPNPSLSESVKSTDSQWDGDELIEISEPPLIRSSKSLQNFTGVNLGQVVSVSIGRGTLPDHDNSDEELKEVKQSSLC